jgi:hypothetical protein
MKTLNKNLGMFFVFGVLLLLTSCSGDKPGEFVDPAQNPDLVDQSWLAEQNCATPCWQGLELGKTSRKEAEAVVGKLSFVGDKTVYEGGPGTTLSYPCKKPVDMSCLALHFQNWVLTDVWLYLNYQITIEQVVERIGLPDSLVISIGGSERPICYVNFLWIKRQMELNYYQEGMSICNSIYTENGRVSKGLFVQTVHYITSEEMTSMIETYQQPDTGYDYQSWVGFSE